MKLVDPFVDAVGKPIASGWARLTGQPGRVLAIYLMLARFGCEVAHYRGGLVRLRGGSLFGSAVAVIATLFVILILSFGHRDDSGTSDVDALPVGWGLMRLWLFIDLVTLPLTVFLVIGDLVEAVGSLLGTVGYAVALARQPRKRSVAADLKDRLARRRLATIPS